MIPGQYAEITVQDSGCGIDPETARDIFEPFFTTKDKDKGTGLGLSTVYGIVKRSGGYILVSSDVGIGTAMRVYLPQVQQAATEGSQAILHLENVRGTGTVLVAEDESDLRSLIAGKLREHGNEVLEAIDGEDAVAIAHQFQGEIQLLITDIVMPNLRGPEVAARVKARYPQVKIIFMSGYTESALVRDGMLQSDTVLLQKPFPFKKILEAVQQLNAGVRS